MSPPRQWNLGAKLALVATPFLVLTLLAIAATLWVSWQLEGGAAAVNEAGRMRMQTYRLSLSLATADEASRAQQVTGLRAQPGAAAQRRPRTPAVRALGRHGARALRHGGAGLGRVRAALARCGTPRRGRTARPVREFRRAHRRAGRRHRSAHVALDRAAAPAADGGADAGGGGRRHAAAHRLPLRARAGVAAQARHRKAAGRRLRHAHPPQQQGRVRHAGQRLQRTGRAPAVDVPQPRSQGGREDLSTAGKGRAPAGAVRREHAHHRCPDAGGVGQRLHAAHRARGACRRRGAALVGRRQPALPAAGQPGPAAEHGRTRTMPEGRRLPLRCAASRARRARDPRARAAAGRPGALRARRLRHGGVAADPPARPHHGRAGPVLQRAGRALAGRALAAGSAGRRT